ncbi:UNVERIFIED_CONTAM: hypothetical protein Sindi_1667300 [Sesamum indicum]
MAEIEKTRLLGGRSEAVSDETDSPTCCHGFSEGNGRFLAGKGDLSSTDLIDSDLGFCAVADSEQTREEDEPTPVVLAMTDEQLMISEGSDTIPVHKASNLAGNEGDKVRRPILGFNGATLNGDNGGQQEGVFNMVEFLRLANTVIDAGDRESRTVLEELKSKWKRHFGKEAFTRCFPATAPHKAPPIVERTPWRTLIPAGDGEKTVGNCSGLKMGLLPAKTRLSGDFDGGSASKKLYRGAGSVSELIPARKSEVQPAIARADVERVHDDVAPVIDDVVADAVADCSADVIADEECDVTADADCDVTADADCDVTNDADCDVIADADSTKSPTGDEEGAPADGEEGEGDDGRQEVSHISGEQHVFPAEPEKTMSERLEEEDSNPSSHGIGEGKSRFLAGKGEIGYTVSSSEKLGFCAAKETEQTHMEDEAILSSSAKQTMGEDDPRIAEDENEFLMRKNMDLGLIMKDFEVQQKLGFSGKSAAEEDERTQTKKLTHDEIFSTTEGCKTIEGDGKNSTMENNHSLTTVHEKSKIGFIDGATSKAVNGGSTGSRSPAEFNFEEFMMLANKVLDGDETSMEALNNLKIRWEAKFGRSYRSVAVPSYIRFRNPWRCSIPPRRNILTGKQADEMNNTTAVTGFSTSPENRSSSDSG